MNKTNGAPEVKRVNYFEGQHLRVTDFEVEQNYHAQMRHLHNRALHTWGVADGLEVNTNDSRNANVKKGMAIDVCGREIVVPKDLTIDIPKGAGATEGDFYLAICYREDCSNGTTTDKCVGGFSRKTESFRVAVLRELPSAWDSDKIGKECDKIGMDCNKVSQAVSQEIPWVALAKITLENCEITEIDNSIRSLVKAQFTGSVKTGGDTMYGALIIDRSGVIERNASEATNTKANRIDFLHLVAHDDVQNEREQIGYISTNKNTIGLRTINDFNNPEDLGDFASLKVHDILADGNVGIGTFTPKHKLEIHGADNSLVILSTASSGAERNAGLELRTTAEDGVTYIDFTKGSTNTEGSGTPDFSGRISYNETNSGAFAILGGHVGIGTANPQGKLTIEAPEHINVILDRTDKDDFMTLTVGSEGTGIHFGNNNRFFISADTYANRDKRDFGNEVFTILSSGNVGLATPNPGAKLHVKAVEPQARIESLGDRTLVQFAKGGALQWDFGVGTGAGNNDFWFGDFTTYRMIIQKGTGNVGIGEPVPKGKLHVSGEAWFTLSGDNGLRIRPGLTGNLYGFSGSDPGFIGLINEEGTWNQAIIIGDVTESSSGILFGVSINSTDIQDPTTGAESGWKSRFEIAGNGNIRIAGSRSYLLGVDGDKNHWIMVGGTTENTHNALGFNTGTKQVVVGPGWTKNFMAHHPLDPEKKFLIHATLEGPEAAVYYRGEAQLSKGSATVKLPDYFEKLTRKENRTILLTPIIEKNEPISTLATTEVKNGKFAVKSIDEKNPSQKFYWEVKAVRADVDLLSVEIPKASTK